MTPGKLRHRVELQQRTTTKDRFGHEQNTWATAFTLYADVQPVGVRERMRAGANAPTTTHTVVIRYSPALKPFAGLAAKRLLYDTRVFNITGALDYEERHEYLILDCMEGPQDGQ